MASCREYILVKSVWFVFSNDVILEAVVALDNFEALLEVKISSCLE